MIIILNNKKIKITRHQNIKIYIYEVYYILINLDLTFNSFNQKEITIENCIKFYKFSLLLCRN